GIAPGAADRMRAFRGLQGLPAAGGDSGDRLGAGEVGLTRRGAEARPVHGDHLDFLGEKSLGDPAVAEVLWIVAGPVPVHDEDGRHGLLQAAGYPLGLVLDAIVVVRRE